jgi:CRISPR-associated protein (TIGR03984 family)
MTAEFKKPPEPRVELLGEIPPYFADGNGAWLVERALALLGASSVTHGLVHADDGVLWTIVRGNRMIFPSKGRWTPELRSKTIQQCRLFGGRGELFIWREAEDRWRGRVAVDQPETVYRQIQEKHILYGDRLDTSVSAPPGFTAIYEGTTGMRQIVPCIVTDSDFDGGHRIALTVTHYLSHDQDGQALISYSRLNAVGLTML